MLPNLANKILYIIAAICIVWGASGAIESRNLYQTTHVEGPMGGRNYKDLIGVSYDLNELQVALALTGILIIGYLLLFRRR